MLVFLSGCIGKACLFGTVEIYYRDSRFDSVRHSLYSTDSLDLHSVFLRGRQTTIIILFHVSL